MVLLTAALAVITAVSIRKNEYFELNQQNEIPRYSYGHPVWAVILTVVMITVCVFLVRRGYFRKHYRGLMLAALLWAVGISIFFIFLFRAVPYADAMACSQIAVRFNHGDFSDFNTAVSDYLTVYPFQTGFIALLQLIYLIAGGENYIAAQMVNAAAVVVIIYICFRMTELTVEDEDRRRDVMGVTALAFIFMLPLYYMVTYIYGDLIAWALAVTALYMFQKYMKCGRVRDIVLSGIMFGLAVQLKSNEWIFVIAAEMALAAHAAARKKIRTVVWMLYLLIPAVLFAGMLKFSYMKAANLQEYPKGAPKLRWIAMGMQDLDDNPMEFGWYNGYNRNLYVDSKYNYNAANAAAKENIRQSLAHYRQEPVRGAYLFYRKFMSQWLEPAFGAQLKIEWQTRHNEGLSALAHWIISGRGRCLIYQGLNSVHFIVIAFSMFFCLYNIKKLREPYLLPLLVIFGGMTFHMLWEAHCRYVLIYYLMLVPFAAAGISDFGVWADSVIHRGQTGK